MGVGGVLADLVFIGFLIYAVVVSNTTGVADACGSKLWEYMLARLILSFVGVFVFVCAGGLLFACLQSPGAIGACMGLLSMVYSAVLLGVGARIVTDALASPACVAALSAVSFTNSPILAILGCVFIGLDALQMTLIVCAGVIFGCMWGCVQ